MCVYTSVYTFRKSEQVNTKWLTVVTSGVRGKGIFVVETLHCLCYFTMTVLAEEKNNSKKRPFFSLESMLRK